MYFFIFTFYGKRRKIKSINEPFIIPSRYYVVQNEKNSKLSNLIKCCFILIAIHKYK